MLHLGLVWLYFFLLIQQSFGHLLLPPFLPAACTNQYYEQKFKISQLDSAEFKISGLPNDIFWTSNGTIFGRPTVSGDWKLTVSYNSVTQSGSYETVLKIKNKTLISVNIDQQSLQQVVSTTPLEMIFPQNLVFLKGKQQLIQFKVKYSDSYQKKQSIIQWKFITLPYGVTHKGDGKLSIKMDLQGMYVLRVQANDLLGNFVEACVTINIQSSRSDLKESFLVSDPNSAINRLLEVRQKQTKLTKELSSAMNKLGRQNETLKSYEQQFSRIGNSLIQLQSQASILQRRITETLRNKLLKQEKLKQALQIVQSAEENLNLALIQQQSTNNLLSQAQKQKSKAQLGYEKASKDLDNQLRLMKTIQTRLINKQQDKLITQNTLSNKKTRYSQLAIQLINKDNQLANINQQIVKSQRELLLSQQQLTTQQSILNSQQTVYSQLQQHITQIQYIITNIEQQLNTLNNKKITITKQCQTLQNLLQTITLTQVVTLQQDMKNTQIAIQQMLFDAVTLWNQINHQTSIVKDYVGKVQFAGCQQNNQYSIQGVFKINQGSIISNRNSLQFIVQSGHKVLYGKCTKIPNTIKDTDIVIIRGYTLQGVIHANSIIVSNTNW